MRSTSDTRGVSRDLRRAHLDEQTIAAALLHDVVEDTETELDELRVEFGADIAQLVEGVTKLTRITFSSREQAEAENYRKMIVAMAQDVRVILIKLADRLHNMRTIEYLGSRSRCRRRRRHSTSTRLSPTGSASTREVGARGSRVPDPPPAQVRRDHRDGRRPPRGPGVPGRGGGGDARRRAGEGRHPRRDLGRAKHFYSIYDKMAKKGREFNEIYDLTAMRVIVERGGDEGTRDCYGALGLIHSLWKPMPGRFKDFIAMPKLNRYRSLHTTVIGPDGHAARDPGAHARDARGSRVRRRCPLAVQARQVEGRRRVADVGARR